MKIVFLSFLLTLSAHAEVFNYKNINSVAGIICDKTTTHSQMKSFSQFKIDKEEIAAERYRIQLNGTCNNLIENGTIKELGEEISLEFDSQSKTGQGTIGIKKIEFKIGHKGIEAIRIIDPLFNSRQTINLASSQWAASNMIFTRSPMKIRIARKIAATEQAGMLKIGNSNQLYDIWNYQSYGCSLKISPTECEALNK